MNKYSLTVLICLCFSLFANAQEKNEILYQSIIKNDSEKVTQLLKDNADANYIKSMGAWMKVNMLITAVNGGNIETIKALIKSKADVNWKDGFNSTALMYAAEKGSMDIVNLLLENGADINASDGQGNTVLTAARESKNKELVKLIQERLKTNK
jgi:ankyrin repeat protein